MAKFKHLFKNATRTSLPGVMLQFSVNTGHLGQYSSQLNLHSLTLIYKVQINIVIP